jgi:hypothetical protein
VVCSSKKSSERILETSRKLQRKGKKSDGEGCMLQSLISLSDVVEFLLFSYDPVPLFNFLKTSPFPSNFIFD